jgi:uncharacterized repeat protein (TIGR01451 family)
MRILLFGLTLILGAISATAQPAYTAQDRVTPYTAGFHPAVNNGYHPGWTNAQLGDLASKAGGRAMRVGFTEEIAELFGYDILLPLFEWYGKRGMKEHTIILQGPIDWHRDSAFYCPQARSALFKNLYAPIWDGGINGTPYNDDNYFAAYVYRMATTYKAHVRFWEVWNEPGFDLTGGTGWLPQGFPKNWWENDPAPCDYILYAPVQQYVRTLRVAWEVIKTVDPSAYVTCSGVGYPAFLDAVLRHTDNPNGGTVTAQYPLRGGAYFDAVGFHSYPHFDGSVRYWDNQCQCMTNLRHSDGAADGIIRNQGIYQAVLNTYGFDGVKFPKKVWNITEGNIPGKSFKWGDEFLLGGQETQRNFIVKAMVRMMQNDIQQFALFQIFNLKTLAEATQPFEAMGLYELPSALGKVPPRSPQGIAYETAALHLYRTTYDAARTNALQLSANTGGAAFRTPAGRYVYVLWAKTQTDRSESATAQYRLPATVNTGMLQRRNWDFSVSFAIMPLTNGDLTLTETPIFLTDDAAWAVPVADNRPKIDLELSMSGSPAAVQAGQNAVFSLTIANKGTTAATNVKVIEFLHFGKTFLTDRLRYVSHNTPAGTQFNPLTSEWQIPTLGAGASLTLSVTTKSLNGSLLRVFAQVGAADQPDTDSQPLNGQTEKIPFEDDEALAILNNNGLLDTRPDLVVESTTFPTGIEPGKAFMTTLMVRNNSMVSGGASRIRYWLSADSLLSANDIQLAADPVMALVSYAYATFHRPLTLPANTTAGRWFLLYQCDADQQVAEWDEANVFARPVCVLSNCNPLSTATGGIDIKNAVRIYPNPATRQVFIQMDDAPAGGFEVRLFNVMGCMVKHLYTSGNILECPVAELATGLYQVNVSGRFVGKIIVLRDE